MKEGKPFKIPKELVSKAYLLVKRKGGAPGIDGVTISDFEKDLRKNLYKLWNRLSSGSYFPPAVMGVEIPKKDGSKRLLGVPTVGDRVAQMAIRLAMEEHLEPLFDKDSYGYRPNKSAHGALAVTRERCWKFGWILEFDIKGLFDNIPHDLLMKALKKHVKERWIILSVERWLKAPISKGGEMRERNKGTPQGGVISPLLANLFMHYAFDAWMRREFPNLEFCRYADDGLVHCRSENEAQDLKERLSKRLEECGLEMHPKKTKIAYCKSSNRKGTYKNIKFDFLGYTFRPRGSRSGRGIFTGFLPAVSRDSLKAMGRELRRWELHRKTNLTLEQLAKRYNPIIRGWINYYSKFYKSALHPFLNRINLYLFRWMRNKYKNLKRNKVRSIHLWERIVKGRSGLFEHWKHTTIIGNGEIAGAV